MVPLPQGLWAHPQFAQVLLRQPRTDAMPLHLLVLCIFSLHSTGHSGQQRTTPGHTSVLQGQDSSRNSSSSGGRLGSGDPGGGGGMAKVARMVSFGVDGLQRALLRSHALCVLLRWVKGSRSWWQLYVQVLGSGASGYVFAW